MGLFPHRFLRRSGRLPWPAPGLFLIGPWVQVEEGQRLKRAVMGFGAGATETLAQVEVFGWVQIP